MLREGKCTKKAINFAAYIVCKKKTEIGKWTRLHHNVVLRLFKQLSLVAAVNIGDSGNHIVSTAYSVAVIH